MMNSVTVMISQIPSAVKTTSVIKITSQVTKITSQAGSATKITSWLTTITSQLYDDEPHNHELHLCL